MMFTKEDIVEAYLAGANTGEYYCNYHPDKPFVEMVQEAAELYASLQFERCARRIATEGATIDQTRSGHLPPNGTPEEVLARALGSFMCRAFMVFSGGVKPETVFNAEWYWPTMEALRNAYPVLGALEDARVEETV